MENDAIHLEHQTAPESTRGLFDPPADKAPEGVVDKRRSFHAYGPLTEKPSQQGQGQRFVRGHQRSRSAVMLSNGSGRRSFGLQPLAEEGSEDDSKKKTEQQDEDATVTVDSLKDMINTLKALPPVNLKDSGLNRNSCSHRKHSSASLTKGFGPDTMQSMVQSTVQELRNIPNDKNAKRRSRRAASMSSSMEASAAYRNAALAEAEAKLSGNLGSNIGNRIEEEEPRTQPMARRHSTSRATRGFAIDENSRLPGRRRYSESSSTFDRGALGVTGKRMSLQQLPTLSENTVLPNANRRLTFNKPLTLEDSNKRMSHSRRSSRNLDFDWRSTSNPVLPPFSPTTAAQQSFNLVPFTPTRVSFAKDDANPHQRRPLFIAHLPFSALPPLFRSRQLVRGTLRVNKRNRSDAYVSCDDLDDDVYVCGSRDRNRALEGDVVAVRLVDVEKVLREKKEKEEAKLARNGGKPKTRMPDEEDENEIIFGGDEDVETVKPKYCGVVVAVLERAQNQVFSGSLTLMRPNNKRAQEEKEAEEARKAEGDGAVVAQKEAPRIVWFKATDKRVPLIAIPIEQAPADFVTNSDKYANKLFVGSIKRWPITSLHPFGSLEREIGTVTDLDVQTMGILADNNVSTADFSDAAKGCIPEISDELINEENRRDLTDVHAFTIDPSGSNVLDDALSIEETGDDSYSIGVHISDVASFIQPQSPLDKEARDRGVRVDLHHKYIPMLPEDLTNKLTNLEPDQKRWAISIVWKMNSKGDILDTWVGKSLVRSSTKLSYEDAQKIIDGDIAAGDSNIPDATVQGIRSLYSIAKILRESRVKQDGALLLKRDRLAFEFENGKESAPTAVSMWKEPESAIIVREFLLLANKVVAQKISSHFPELALLRRQAPPVARKIRELKDYADRCLGVQVDISSAEALGRSIASVEDPTLRKMLSVIVLKTFYPPKYFCTGTLDIQKYSHYSLNTPLFTHFTAPSRRYADIVVQRQLVAALTGNTEFYLERDTMQKLAHHCNVKKEAALIARENSNLLFLAMHLCAKQQPPSSNIVLYRDAIVVAVSEQHFDVMIPEYNIEKRVHLAHLPVWKGDYDQGQHTLTIHWKKNIATSTGNDRHHWNFVDDEDDEEEELDEDLLIAEMQQDSSEEEGNNKPYNTNGSSSLSDGTSAKVNDLKIAESAPTVTPAATTSTTKRTSRRASVLRARLSDSTAYNTEQATQTIKALDRIKAVVIVEMVKPPPLIRVLAANPYA